MTGQPPFTNASWNARIEELLLWFANRAATNATLTDLLTAVAGEGTGNGAGSGTGSGLNAQLQALIELQTTQCQQLSDVLDKMDVQITLLTQVRDRLPIDERRVFTFTAANLTDNRITFNHGLGVSPVPVLLFDQNGYEVEIYDVVPTSPPDLNNVTIDVTGLTITGTWTVLIQL